MDVLCSVTAMSFSVHTDFLFSFYFILQVIYLEIVHQSLFSSLFYAIV